MANFIVSYLEELAAESPVYLYLMFFLVNLILFLITLIICHHICGPRPQRSLVVVRGRAVTEAFTEAVAMRMSCFRPSEMPTADERPTIELPSVDAAILNPVIAESRLTIAGYDNDTEEEEEEEGATSQALSSIPRADYRGGGPMLQLDVKARARRANRRGDRPAVDLRRGDLLVSARIEPATLGASRSLGMALIQDVLPDVAGVKVIRVSSITPGAPLAASGVLVGWRMVAVSLGGDEREPIHTIHSALVAIRSARAEGVPFTLWFEAPEERAGSAEDKAEEPDAKAAPLGLAPSEFAEHCRPKPHNADVVTGRWYSPSRDSDLATLVS